LTARGRRRRVLPVQLPGAIGRGFRAGGHLTPEHAEGRITFEEYLAGPGQIAPPLGAGPHRGRHSRATGTGGRAPF
jgi:hypothetical protein